MCAYKLVSAKFQVFGLQTRIEGFIENTQWSVFLKFHKELFMLIDEWYGLTMEDIRRMEQELKAELDVVRISAQWACTLGLDSSLIEIGRVQLGDPRSKAARSQKATHDDRQEYIGRECLRGSKGSRHPPAALHQRELPGAHQQ